MGGDYKPENTILTVKDRGGTTIPGRGVLSDIVVYLTRKMSS